MPPSVCSEADDKTVLILLLSWTPLVGRGTLSLQMKSFLLSTWKDVRPEAGHRRGLLNEARISPHRL